MLIEWLCKWSQPTSSLLLRRIITILIHFINCLLLTFIHSIHSIRLQLMSTWLQQPVTIWIGGSIRFLTKISIIIISSPHTMDRQYFEHTSLPGPARPLSIIRKMKYTEKWVGWLYGLAQLSSSTIFPHIKMKECETKVYKFK